MPCTDTENTPLPGDTENVLLRKLLNRLCNVTSGGGGGVSQAYVDARDAATLLAANNNAVAGDAATLAAAMASASGLYVLKAGDTMTGALLQPAGTVGAPALSRSGDTDTGIWYPAANTWAISTAGAERVRILSTGFVGVGVSVPKSDLHIGAGGEVLFGEMGSGGFGRAAGNVNQFFISANQYYDGGVKYAQAGGAAQINFDIQSGATGGDLAFLTAPIGAANGAQTQVQRLTIKQGGNVGIGIILPLAKLHITPAASGTDYFRIDHSDGTPRFQFGALTGALTNGALWFGDIVPDATNYGLANNGATTFLNADTGGAINFSLAGASVFNMSSAGHLLWTPDNTYNIGATGANRPANYFGAGTVNAVGGLITGNVASLVTSSAAMNNGAAAALGTLTNAPAAGNPTKWIPIDDNGTTRYIPTW